jgi:hypothetical protein
MLGLAIPASGILTISADLLALIFEESAANRLIWTWEHQFTTPAPYSTVPNSQKRAIIISHVCRQWRAVALDTASLWTSPNFTYRDDGMDFEMVRRAKRASLNVKIKLHVEKSEWITQFQTEFMPIVEKMWIRAPHSTIISLLENTPRLRALSVQTWGDKLDVSHFTTTSPTLSTLSLNKVVSLPPLQIFCAITRLFIFYGNPTPDQLSQLVTIIPHAPNLVELVAEFLQRDEEEWDDTELGNGTSILLPYLRAITLTGDFVCCTAVIDRLAFGSEPSRIVISEHNDVYQDEQQYDVFESFVRSHTADPRFSPVHAKITVTPESTFVVELHSSDGSTTILQLVLSEDEDGDEYWMERSMNLLELIEWDNLSSLTIDIKDDEMAGDVLNRLDSFDGLEELEELHLACESSFVAFYQEGQYLFPGLQCLIVSEIRIIGDEESKTAKDSGKCLRMLMTMLESWLSVQRVVLKGCFFESTKKDLIRNALLKHVVQVKFVE